MSSDDLIRRWDALDAIRGDRAESQMNDTRRQAWEAVRALPAVARDAGEGDAHAWAAPNETVRWPHCGRCGVIRRADGSNSATCKGAPLVTLRDRDADTAIARTAIDAYIAGRRDSRGNPPPVPATCQRCGGSGLVCHDPHIGPDNRMSDCPNCVPPPATPRLDPRCRWCGCLRTDRPRSAATCLCGCHPEPVPPKCAGGRRA